MECIVLAGGLGTRLKGTIGDYPKCMATINGKPFLHYIFEYLQQQGCSHVILSLGYKHEVIIEWLKTQQLSFKVSYVIEQEPLGTGGGIQLALGNAKTSNVAVLNGDTMFQVNLAELFTFHKEYQAETTLALKEMHQFERYGSVVLNEEHAIFSFEEKSFKEHGFINGGVYVINREAFLQRFLPHKFSFEKDYLEAFVSEQKFYGKVFRDYFIDIGIPEDYQKAQEDFKLLFS